MPPSRSQKDRPANTQKRLKKIRSQWRGLFPKAKKSKGTVEQELSTYFNATLFNAYLSLDELKKRPNTAANITKSAKQLRLELDLVGEVGEFMQRKILGYI